MFTEQILHAGHYFGHWRKSCKQNKNSSFNGICILLGVNNNKQIKQMISGITHIQRVKNAEKTKRD